MSGGKNNPSQPGVTPLSGARTVTGPRLATGATGPGSVPAVTPVPDGATRLRVVTIAPGTQSFPDVEAPSRDRRDPYVGAVIDGRYRVETVLGEGGMGVVYRCKHTIIGKQLALKVLRADLARDAEVTERFLNEAKSASMIGNPHIIDISDFGQFPDGATYFVMEYLTGTPLGNTIEGGKPLPAPRLLAIVRQLAEGLSAAHAAGIVHRDLKPDNIFLIERGAHKDFVKILDFGIAKASTNEGKLTRAGAVFGTPHYMSPEQAAGASVDQRGDIYSLGVIMYELASGRVPFDADNFMGVLSQHMYRAPTPLSEVTPEPLRPGLEAVVMKCLAKKPEQRYQSMDELIVDIDRLLAGTRPQAANETGSKLHAPAAYFEGDATPSSALRKRPVGLVIGLIVFLLGVVALGLVLRGGEEPVSAEAAKPAPTPVATPPTVSAKVPPPAAAPSSRRVVVATEPLDATFFKDGKNIGTAPVTIEVPNGKNVELLIERAGYKSARLVLDGSEPTQSIKLERAAAPAKPKPASKPATTRPATTSDGGKKRPRLGGDGIIDPWSK